jgi:hypothetical protein
MLTFAPLTFTPPAGPATAPGRYSVPPLAKTIESVIPKEHAGTIAEMLGLPPPGTLVERALKFINSKRGAVQPPLDPKAARWTDDDVIIEAKRLGWQG